MAQLLHGSTTTTVRTRAEFQASAEPAAVQARRYGVNPKTVTKWRQRQSMEDQRGRAEEGHSSLSLL